MSVSPSGARDTAAARHRRLPACLHGRLVTQLLSAALLRLPPPLPSQVGETASHLEMLVLVLLAARFRPRWVPPSHRLVGRPSLPVLHVSSPPSGRAVVTRCRL
eukprot:8703251-Heterocapsa_arctica.AAC.1